MIIVEGPDHVGKTIFCKKLVAEMKRKGVADAKYKHMSKPTEDFDYFGDYMSQLWPGYVYDRFHYGAFVYGAMLRLHPTEGFSLESMRLVSRFINLRHGLIVVMKDSDHEEYARRLYQDGKEEMFKLRDMKFANMLFSNIQFIDQPDIVLDIKGGDRWPTDKDAKLIVSEWRFRNGL